MVREMDNQEQIYIFDTKNDLIKAAEKQASRVEEDYKHSTYLYYIVRYFVSVFESRYGAIPLQVWNEYRNALDHFFRYLTNNADNQVNGQPRQLSKMEGHLQRAALDIMKIHCHKTKDSVSEMKKSYKPEVLQLVDNGDFFTYLISETNRAEQLFEEAKIYDSNLGETASLDKEVLEKYLEAAFVFDALKLELINKATDINVANQNYSLIHHKGSAGSTKLHIFIHALVYFVLGLIVFILTPFLEIAVTARNGVYSFLAQLLF
ncbi:MAG: hypothetical protein A6F71_10635 [Cycloclasticus sp. symbiont of Poecilosclerida sp. M]|nr:MAG: hypothetical protein A6F71_10635 [Cycloclasticus sp. symbiont of Poecilosclerida sp. M]